jgi:hypothetical protein
MVVSLLEIDGKVTSLEFDEADLTEVSGAIVGQFGEFRILRKTPTFNEVEFGGEHFTHYHEWTPCLLPRTERGKNMLRLIAADFPAKPPKPMPID